MFKPASGDFKGYEYSRTSNPTGRALKQPRWLRSPLCPSLASGCAGATAIMGALSAGDHVLCGDDVYGGDIPADGQGFANLGLSSPLWIKRISTQFVQPCAPRQNCVGRNADQSNPEDRRYRWDRYTLPRSSGYQRCRQHLRHPYLQSPQPSALIWWCTARPSIWEDMVTSSAGRW